MNVKKDRRRHEAGDGTDCQWDQSEIEKLRHQQGEADVKLERVKQKVKRRDLRPSLGGVDPYRVLRTLDLGQNQGRPTPGRALMGLIYQHYPDLTDLTIT